MMHRLNRPVVLVALVMVFSLSGTAWADDLPPEPSEAFLVREHANMLIGLYFREYSLPGNGIIDYRTARQILLAEYNEHWDTVGETKAYPLFYWYDADQDGEFAQ